MGAYFIILSVLLDKLDGFAARLVNASSEFGAQFDSLADLIAFGLAPAFTVFFTYKTLDTLYYGKKMFDEGVYVNPVMAPACVEGECLLRTTLMATHTEPVIDEATEIIARVLREGAPEGLAY